MYCKKCGSRLSSEALFCGKCGEPVGQNTDSANPSVRICSVCGAVVPAKYVFCPQCGSNSIISSVPDSRSTKAPSNKVTEKTGIPKAVIICPACGCQMPAGCPVCPNCGKVLADSNAIIIANPTDNNKSKNKLAVILVSVFGGLAVLGALFYFLILPAVKYNGALQSMEDGKYSEAIAVYSELGNYKDSEKLLFDAHISYGDFYCDSSNYDLAIEQYKLADSCAADEEQFDTVKHSLFSVYFNLGKGCAETDPENALTHFSDAEKYAVSSDEKDALGTAVCNARFISGKNLFGKGKLDDAIAQLTMCIESSSDQQLKKEASLLAAEIYIQQNDLVSAKNIYTKLGMLNEYTEKILNKTYDEAVALVSSDPEAAAEKLYPLAKEEYKDSREILDGICTIDWLFDHLSFTDVDIKQIDQETEYYYTGYTDGYYDDDGNYHEGQPSYTPYVGSATYKVFFNINNNSPVPIVGNFEVLLITKDERGKKHEHSDTVKIIKTAQAKTAREGKTEDYKIDGDEVVQNATFRKITDKNGLRVDYDFAP